MGCRSDDDCPSQESCINRKCVNPCEEIRPCGLNAVCTVLDTHPVKTMTCDCLPDYRGNAVEHCEPSKLNQIQLYNCQTFALFSFASTNTCNRVFSVCQLEKGQIRNEYGECVCPPNHAKNDKGICIPCYPEAGVMIDENGICRGTNYSIFAFTTITNLK